MQRVETAGPVQMHRGEKRNRLEESSDDEDLPITAIVPHHHHKKSNATVTKAVGLKDQHKTTEARKNAFHDFQAIVRDRVQKNPAYDKNASSMLAAHHASSEVMMQQMLDDGFDIGYNATHVRIEWKEGDLQLVRNAFGNDPTYTAYAKGFFEISDKNSFNLQMARAISTNEKCLWAGKKGAYQHFDYKTKGPTTEEVGKMAVQLVRFMTSAADKHGDWFSSAKIAAAETDLARFTSQLTQEMGQGTPAHQKELKETEERIAKLAAKLKEETDPMFLELYARPLPELKVNVVRLKELCQQSDKCKELQKDVFFHKQRLAKEKAKAAIMEVVWFEMMTVACALIGIPKKFLDAYPFPKLSDSADKFILFARNYADLAMRHVYVEAMVPRGWALNTRITHPRSKAEGAKMPTCVLHTCDIAELVDRYKELQFFMAKLASRPLGTSSTSSTSSTAAAQALGSALSSPAAAGSSIGTAVNLAAIGSAARPALSNDGVSSSMRR